MTFQPIVVRSPEDLKAARGVLGLSADSLAKMLRIADGRVIRKWEAGAHEIPGPVIVILETAMGYLHEREKIARQLAMLRSGRMTGGSNIGSVMVADTAADIARLVEADNAYASALEILTRRPVDDAMVQAGDETSPQSRLASDRQTPRYYHLWARDPKGDPYIEAGWSVMNELSPEAALASMERHHGFAGGLALCGDEWADHYAYDFILAEHELVRIESRNTQVLRAGRVLRQFHVKKRT